MARQIDPKFEEITTKYTKDGESPIKLFKRFLDDMSIVYTGPVPTLHMFFGEINQIHPKTQIHNNALHTRRWNTTSRMLMLSKQC